MKISLFTELQNKLTSKTSRPTPISSPAAFHPKQRSQRRMSSSSLKGQWSRNMSIPSSATFCLATPVTFKNNKNVSFKFQEIQFFNTALLEAESTHRFFMSKSKIKYFRDRELNPGHLGESQVS